MREREKVRQTYKVLVGEEESNGSNSENSREGEGELGV